MPKNEERTYTLRRSARKTLMIEIKPDLTVLVRAPERMPQKHIDKFVASSGEWIDTHLEKQKRRNQSEPALTKSEIAKLKKLGKEKITWKVGYYSRLMGLVPAGVKITSAAKRYGSCSAQNSLCFSWRTMLLPDELIDYIVVHELAHIRHKNHSRDFYALVGQYLPDYRERVRALKKR
jgi:predicted metal-dependent hydrolase